MTTATAKSVLEKDAALESSLLPNSSPRQKLTIETVENKKRVFQDNKHVLELYDIGPNPHANEILIAYLPKEKILFQADMLNPAPNGTIPIAQDAAQSAILSKTVLYCARLSKLSTTVWLVKILGNLGYT